MKKPGANVAFIDDPYEAPTDADIAVDVSKQSVPEIVHSEFPYNILCQTFY